LGPEGGAAVIGIIAVIIASPWWQA